MPSNPRDRRLTPTLYLTSSNYFSDRLRKRAADEKDKQSASKEVRLLRRLLRTDDPKEREKMFEDAFTPKDALLVSDKLCWVAVRT